MRQCPGGASVVAFTEGLHPATSGATESIEDFRYSHGGKAMTETEAQAAQRLQRMSEEVHVDAARHPDPCGAGLQLLAQAIERHISDEATSVRAYRQFARETSDPAVARLMQLLTEDEKNHHALFLEIGRILQDRWTWIEAAPDPAGRGGTCGQTHGEWLGRVRDFEVDEVRGARALRDLAHRAHVECEPLVYELLEAMAMDSDKHARLLRFVAQRLDRPTMRASEEA
jgi:hypothetical protein